MKRKSIFIVIIILLCGLLAGSLYLFFDQEADYVVDAIVTEAKTVTRNIEYVQSGGLTEGADAQLTAPAMGVSLPVSTEKTEALSNKEFYYLNHDIDGRYSVNGTLFVTFGTDIAKDRVLTIFGHRMRSGAMFGNIDRYFSDNEGENAYLRLDVGDTARYYVKVCAFDIPAESDFAGVYPYLHNFSSISEFNAFIEMSEPYLAAGSLSGIDVTDEIVLLSTCSLSGVNREVVLFKKLPQGVELSTKEISKISPKILASEVSYIALAVGAGILAVIVILIVKALIRQRKNRKDAD
jgi:hypothetical protein